MARGKRFKQPEPKLNLKKVFLVLLLPILIICVVIFAKNIDKLNFNINLDFLNFSKYKKYKVNRTNPIKYFSSYSDNKWGVIDSNGEIIIPNIYDNMIIIPDEDKDVFITTVIEKEKPITKVLNKNANQILKNINNISPIEEFGDYVYYNKQYLKFQNANNKFGIIDFNGTKIFEPKFDDIKIYKNIPNRLFVKTDDKTGVINTKTGNYTIPDIYKEITPLMADENTPYAVKFEDKYGAISGEGNTVLETEYDEIYKIESNKYVYARKGKNKILYDLNGKEVLKNPKYDIINVQENSIIAKQNNKLGLLDFKNTQIIPFNYQEIERAGFNQYIVKQNNKYNIRVAHPSSEDKTQQKEDIEKALQKDYTYITYIPEGDIYIANPGTKDSKVDIINNLLEVKLNGVISEINNDKGYFVLKDKKIYKYYLFNLEEKKASEILDTNNLFMFERDGKIGYMTSENQEIVAPIYDQGYPQNKFGFIAVSRNNKWGVLDHEGNVIIEPSIDMSEHFIIDFISNWYLDKDLELNTYKKVIKSENNEADTKNVTISSDSKEK